MRSCLVRHPTMTLYAFLDVGAFPFFVNMLKINLIPIPYLVCFWDISINSMDIGAFTLPLVKSICLDMWCLMRWYILFLLTICTLPCHKLGHMNRLYFVIVVYTMCSNCLILLRLLLLLYHHTWMMAPPLMQWAPHNQLLS